MKPLVFLDIETTGASAARSRVLEIGAVRVENGQEVARLSQLVFPEEHVPAFITRLTGISNQMVQDSPLFVGVADELDRLMEGAVFVAHNVNFDYSFIKMEYQRLGRVFSYDKLCTVRLSRALYPNQTRHNLDTIIATHNLLVAARHRALDDALVLHQFYQKVHAEYGDAIRYVLERLTTPALHTAR